jgi:predicted site-specific integrase-resolvase
MKAKHALKLLGVTRVTLWRYVKDGAILATELGNGYYDYDDTSIYNFLGNRDRKNVIYARVSTYKQKNDLSRQVDFISSYCADNKILINDVYKEIASGISLDRNIFQQMLEEVIAGKVQRIFISYRDRLSRLSFSTLSSIFTKFNTEIIVVSDELHSTGSKNNNIELYEDLLAMMHYFTTKNYSLRKNKVI